MFNVLIEANGTAWETDQLMRMDIRRFKEDSDSEAETVSISRPESLKKLEEAATLLMYEIGAEGPNIGLVRYGHLRNIKAMKHEILFTFIEEGRLPRKCVHEFADRLGIGRLMLNHTHWAIKDAGIPADLLSRLIPTYDVVFSFAGENRAYVKKVADYLLARGIRIFYDEFEQVKLWGKDLAEHFGLVYRQSASYCVMFISEFYIAKMWTRHERQFAVSRAMEERREYILPARFDRSEVMGVPPSVHYIELADKTPAQFGKLILEKLGQAGVKK
jgi:hypothetical protein